jgi:guanine nucleotide-binding protein G(o) subunit alpha
MPSSLEDKNSKLIDKQLKQAQYQALSTKNLLLLGAGEWGKSTVVKQMRVIYSTGFSDDERRTYLKVCRDNALRSIASILQAMRVLNIHLENPSLESLSENIRDFALEFDGDKDPNVPENIIKGIETLWQDSGVQSCYHRSSEYQLFDCARYFIEKIREICETKYLPSNDDIIRSRQQTQGIVEILIQISTESKKSAMFKIVDVGGQRSQRKKWIHAFEDVTAIIYVAALSDYDLVLAENETTNRMHESLNLFASTIHLKCFKEKNLILFLNKTDLFKEKLPHSSLKNCFPDYTGGEDYDKAVDYINLQFRSKNQSQSRKVYVHYTCATDTAALKFLIDTVADTIIQMNLKEVGLA